MRQYIVDVLYTPAVGCVEIEAESREDAMNKAVLLLQASQITFRQTDEGEKIRFVAHELTEIEDESRRIEDGKDSTE